MKYRDDMTPDETAALIEEVEMLDACYADDDATTAAYVDVDPEEAEAVIEQSRDYFDRYIAGDRC